MTEPVIVLFVVTAVKLIECSGKTMEAFTVCMSLAVHCEQYGCCLSVSNSDDTSDDMFVNDCQQLIPGDTQGSLLACPV